MIEFGQIKKVDIKTIWKNEALNFTPWLTKSVPLSHLPFAPGPAAVQAETL
jgi:hypothetical protein